MTTYSGYDFWVAHPTPWPVAPLRRLGALGTGHTPSRSQEEYWQDCTVPWVTTEDLTSRVGTGLEPLLQTRQQISELGLANSAAVLHPPDTVMLSRTASVGHVVRIGRPMATTQAFATWTCGRELDPRYLLLVLNAMQPEFERIAYGSTHLTIYMPDIEQIRVPVPPMETQRAIADFLDTETARIDALLAKKRRMISLLIERSVVSQIELVTGRVGGGPLRASGLEWLGDIPVHWSVERLKHLARPESGHTPSRSRPELWEDCTVPWITLNDVGHLAANEFITETVNLISTAGLAASSARVLPAGTVVLSRDATIGRVGIMSCPMATSQHFVDWVCGPRLKPRFLWLLFRTAMQGHFESLTDGATLRTIGMPDVLAFSVPLPPRLEQDVIVKKAEAHRIRAHATTAALRRQIELLQEHKQAIITAAVTGELEVPGVAA